MISLVLLAAVVGLGDLSSYPDAKKYGALPLDVRVLIDRRIQCNHWSGEEPYDPARRRQINRAVRDLRCNTVESEAKRLTHRYAGSPTILRALAETRDWQ